jgi:hypothetical protein
MSIQDVASVCSSCCQPSSYSHAQPAGSAMTLCVLNRTRVLLIEASYRPDLFWLRQFNLVSGVFLT